MEHLRELRESKGLLQREVADAIKVGRTTYVKYETGKSEPSHEILSRIADFFGVSIDYLLGHKSEEGEKEKAVAGSDGERERVVNILRNLPEGPFQRVAGYIDSIQDI